ncbi:MAG: protein TolR [Deltaproteobacteria bacterium]|nr:protein TolR [Deltaproteobacteria bacterium]HCH65120.1 protein TolR [Deltaproteobacteria bacterium]
MGMSAGGGGGNGPMADINVTPLVDVMLVLIIIFMLITPVLTSGVDVRLPKAKSVDEGQDVGQNIAISVKADESVYVGKNQTSTETLIADLQAEYENDPARGLLIKGDKRLKWKHVHKVMWQINDEGGMSTMLLAVEKSKE